MSSNNKILIEILKNFSFKNKILTENEHIIFELNNRVMNNENSLVLLEKKITDIYKKLNDIYSILYNINDNIGINNIILTVSILLQFIILFKIF